MPTTIAVPTLAPDTTPNRFLRAQDWSDPRYAHLRETFHALYRDEMGGEPHPSHARHPESVVMHWSREWEYPWAVLNAQSRPGMTAVDLGCGGSPLLPYLARRVGCACTGVDLTLRSTTRRTNLRGFRDAPERLYPEIDWLTRSMDDTGLPDHSCDRVFCVSVLEHVSPELASSTFREIRRLLRPSGLALITTDVDGGHRTLSIDYSRLIEIAKERGLRLHGSSDFRAPPPDARPGEYDVVGLALRAAGEN